MFKRRLLIMIVTFITMSAIADTETVLHSNILQEKTNNLAVMKELNTNHKEENPRKLNLVLPKDIMARVRKDERMQQRDKPNKVLPNLFDKNQVTTGFGVTGDFIKSADIKERGDIDGAEIQFHFKQ